MSRIAQEVVCPLPEGGFFCSLRLPTGVNHHTAKYLLYVALSFYVFWAGCWGWSPVYRAFKTSMEQAGCIFLATPMTWIGLILVGAIVLFAVAECYGACGVAIARHRKAALIASGKSSPQPF